MNELNIKIGNREYKVKVAQTEKEHEKGLQGVESLGEQEGMLFIFDEVQSECNFWMEDTNIPLDIVFINEDLEVISIKQGIPNTTNYISEIDVAFVLEVNINSGIKVGDDLEFSTNHTVKKDKMLVLDSNGKTQMELEGGERIFSRPNTKILIKFAKKAEATQKENDYKNLGKKIFKFLQTQSDTNPEYVKSKN
jgi:uncharacterized membrane protein (UPF0127 family)